MTYKDVYRFWFEEIDSSMWWKKSDAFDKRVTSEFSIVLAAAAVGELDSWRESPQGRLSEIIVLDQFSRNIYRNTANAFAQDVTALILAQEAVSLGILDDLPTAERSFLLMPYMHSESLYIHDQAERLFKQYTSEQSYQFELKHKAILDRFGRYPHRNDILGRTSTEEELSFLQQPGSSF